MRYLELPTLRPAEYLAADEALLDWCADHPDEECLGFWESPTPFVVLGHSNQAAREANLPACAELRLPVLRRCSGGGAVVQGPGCLNYLLVCTLAGRPQLATVPATNRFIMETHRQVLAALLREPVEVRGITDLAIRGRKFSGNAQKRGRTHVLFHGTFLLGFDLSLIGRVLRPPSREPAYRAGRAHHDFVMNLTLGRREVMEALGNAWQASSVFDEPLGPLLQPALERRYDRPEWHARF